MPEPLTTAEKARRFGCYDRDLAHLMWEQELLRRLDAGLPLTKADAKEARRIKRARTYVARIRAGKD